MKNWIPSRRLGTIPAILLGLYPFGQVIGQTVMLKPTFKPGQTYYLVRTMDVKQSVSGGGPGQPNMTTDIHSLLGVMQRVESVAKDAVRLLLTNERMVMKMSMPTAAPLSFDSDADPDDQDKQLAEIFKPMVGHKMTMELDGQGAVKSFTGADELVKKVDKSAAGNQVWGMIRKGEGDDACKRLWGESHFILYPYKEVKVGESWKRTRSRLDDQIGELSYAYEIKLDGISKREGRKIALLSYSGTVTKVADAEGSEKLSPTKMEYKSGQFSGKATFDIEMGRIVDQTEEGQIKLDIQLRAPGMSEVPTMAMDVSMKSTLALSSPQEREKQRAATAKKDKEDKPKKTEKGKKAKDKKKTSED